MEGVWRAGDRVWEPHEKVGEQRGSGLRAGLSDVVHMEERRRAKDHHRGSSLGGASPQGSSPKEKIREGLRVAVRSAPERLKVKGLLTDRQVQTPGVFVAVWLWVGNWSAW